MTPDHERVIRERLKSAAEGYPIHHECGGECQDFGAPAWLCNDCGERPMPEQIIMPWASDDYIEDVAALLAALDEARAALGPGWLAVGSLADGIRAKCAMLERLTDEARLEMLAGTLCASGGES